MRMFAGVKIWCATYFLFWAPLHCFAEWDLLTDREAYSVAAHDGHVFAATKDGLRTMSAISGMVLDPTLNSSAVGDVDKVFIQRNGIHSKVYVLANSTLYVSNLPTAAELSEPYKWTRVFADTEKGKIIDIHGHGTTIAFLEKEEPTEDPSADATHRNTVRSRVWVSSNTADPKECIVVGMFAATRVFVTTDGVVMTYGDIYGPYPPDLGFYKRKQWRHEQPLHMKEGRLFYADDILYLSSPEVGVLKSYDLGRNFEVVTKSNGIPSAAEYTDVVSSGSVVFIATRSNGLYISTDEGASISLHSSQGSLQFPSDNVIALYLDLQPDGSALYVATDKGLAVKRAVGKGEVRQQEKTSWLYKAVYGADDKYIF